MRFGLTLGRLNPRRWAEVTEAADRLGFESVWLPEHLVLPVVMSGSPYAGSSHPPIPAETPVFDVFACLGWLAARTERIRLGTHVYNVGLRHPFVTARGTATVDVLSGGRMILGVGASWMKEEWDAVGLDFATRGARVDEAIEVCRRLWSEPVVEHHGRFFDFPPVAFEPKPVNRTAERPGIPVHVGGDGPAAIRRTVRLGDGWLPMNVQPASLAAAVAGLDAECRRQGRAGRPEVTVALTPRSPAEVADAEAAGATRMIVGPWTRSSEALDSIRRFREDFAAAWSEP